MTDDEPQNDPRTEFRGDYGQPPREQTQPSITALVKKLEDDGHATISAAIRNGRIDNLTDDELATIDAAVFGFGILVSGQRVDPLTVRLVSYERARAES